MRLTGIPALEWAEKNNDDVFLAGTDLPMTPAEARALLAELAEEGADLEIYVDTEVMPAAKYAPKVIECRCGEWTGKKCAWSGPESETVVVEYMPEFIRASHTAARNSGTYPANGAIRVRVEKSCADLITKSEPEWASVVG